MSAQTLSGLLILLWIKAKAFISSQGLTGFTSNFHWPTSLFGSTNYCAKQTTSNCLWITLNPFPWASWWSQQCSLPVFTGLSGLGWPQANTSFLFYLVFHSPSLPGLFPWPQWQVPRESKRHFTSSLESSLLPSHCPKWPKPEFLLSTIKGYEDRKT